ncbi:MAG TPA: hypothetical protein VJP58_06585 [Candidatus Nitrosocosmicus sp.]|nr:hypothetical protein [Candidatus Nitrosocosmicus sp.]
MNKSINVLAIIATITASGTIIPSLAADILNQAMAQGNLTEGNSTAGNMTEIENITSTTPSGLEDIVDYRHAEIAP